MMAWSPHSASFTLRISGVVLPDDRQKFSYTCSHGYHNLGRDRPEDLYIRYL
jgi:hypothetical protein